ncbi:GDP-mannose pyrophosphatase NudK [Flavobacterium sangjuense]|uniref:GDP-mannose pyrophosphatase n=1 Tax=Flavobacterium sangjuense TaxID=2518177 RepID=A0A4P7PVT3_9FLAO|nr:GDP-mannose pyrophosphatase NudK [Flavobacterium sangjuense]QBZ99108.1 GDP-mannose pyrophosphatase NudK [Flavobacterium sangjuense]
MSNPKIEILKNEILSDNWYTLRKVTYNYLKKDGQWETQSREAYDRGNGATILLYNKNTKTIILTRQFRLPTYLNGNETGMLIEACAGLLDKDNAEECIRRETEEETGYKISSVEKIFEVYMSPGSVTEIVHFFTAEYTKDMKINDGGGVADEQENIEVLELDFDKAYDMIASGEIKDAKTIMLLQHAKINLCW